MWRYTKKGTATFSPTAATTLSMGTALLGRHQWAASRPIQQHNRHRPHRAIFGSIHSLWWPFNNMKKLIRLTFTLASGVLGYFIAYALFGRYLWNHGYYGTFGME